MTGALPQSKVMTPPLVTAACSWAKVQLAAVPVPTTVVGRETSAGCPCAGTPAVQWPLGFPACIVPPSELPLPELEPDPEDDPAELAPLDAPDPALAPEPALDPLPESVSEPALAPEATSPLAPFDAPLELMPAPLEPPSP